MAAWLSPFPIPEALERDLSRLGWSRWSGTAADLPAGGAWLYGPPDRLLALLELDPAQILAGYQQLLNLPAGTRLLALGRILGSEATDPDPLAAAITQLLLAQQPQLLDAYLDLELKADLGGEEPDLGYRQRLLQACRPDGLVLAWRSLRAGSNRQEELEALQAELEAAQGQLKVLEQREQEAREEAELTLLQLHQVQEELEQIFLADREKQAQLEQLADHPQQLEALRAERDGTHQQGQQQLEALQAELEAAQGQLKALEEREQEAREEAELTLLQLHQVQEELEHYFLLSRGQGEQLQRYSALQRRSQRLLAQLVQQRRPVLA